MNFIKNIHIFAYYLKKRLKQKKPLWPYLYDLLNALYINYTEKSPLELELPWVEIRAIKCIEKFLEKNMRAFEYGSGGSTLYFSKKIMEIVSIEHDSDWFEIVNQTIKQKKIENSTLILIPPEKPTDENTVRYPSKWKKEYDGLDFFSYVHAIDTYKDEYFDLILIDGRARPYCLKNSIKKLKPGGIVVFDNAEREHYQEYILKYTQGWKTLEFNGHVAGSLAICTTNIYIKPL